MSAVPPWHPLESMSVGILDPRTDVLLAPFDYAHGLGESGETLTHNCETAGSHGIRPISSQWRVSVHTCGLQEGTSDIRRVIADLWAADKECYPSKRRKSAILLLSQDARLGCAQSKEAKSRIVINSGGLHKDNYMDGQHQAAHGKMSRNG